MEYVNGAGQCIDIILFPLKMLGNDKAVTQPTLGIISQWNMLMVLGNVSILKGQRGQSKLKYLCSII